MPTTPYYALWATGAPDKGDYAILRTGGVSVYLLKRVAGYHLRWGDLDGAACACRLAQIWTPNDTELGALWTEITREIRVRPLNVALIAAAWRDNAAGVSAALAQGADPNARDIPRWPDARKWLLQAERDEYTEASPTPTALKIAVYRDMTSFGEEGALCDYEPDLPKQSRFAIIKALHDAGAKPAADLMEREKSLPKPNALETTASRFPGKTFCIYTNARQALDFADFLKANGMSARAYAELAKGCANLTLCEWAARAARIARLWNPNDATLAEAARNAEEVLRLRRAIQRTLPAASQALRVLPYPNAGKMKRWAVLYRGKVGGLESDYYCAVCGENAGHFTLLFRGKERVSGERGRLFVAPLTGRRLPEILGYAEDEMAGAAPAKMIAYAPEGGHWNRILDVGSNQGVWLERLRHERAYVVRNGYETGDTMCHADQPRRCDIYAYNGKDYTFADAKYPEEFRAYIKEAEDALRIYLDDADLPYHLACCYTFTGQKRKAERYWRRAERAVLGHIANKNDAETQNGYKNTLNDIQARRLVPTDGY